MAQRLLLRDRVVACAAGETVGIAAGATATVVAPGLGGGPGGSWAAGGPARSAAGGHGG